MVSQAYWTLLQRCTAYHYGYMVLLWSTWLPRTRDQVCVGDYIIVTKVQRSGELPVLSRIQPGETIDTVLVTLGPASILAWPLEIWQVYSSMGHSGQTEVSIW